MVVKEFRIVMPFTLADYKTGQRYSTARSSREATTGSDGIELKEKKTFVSDVTGKEGVYTHKIYHLDSHIPLWLKKILPASALRLEEQAWDAYPYCKTVITSPFMGDKFVFTIESQHAEFDPNNIPKPAESPKKTSLFSKKSKDGNVTGPSKNVIGSGRESELPFHDNILKLDSTNLKKRFIHYLDIAMDEVTEKQYRLPQEDPKLVGSEKAKRDPLKKDWQYDNWKKIVAKDPTATPMMCCYKVVTVKCKVFAIANKVENYLMGTETNIFLRFHKQLFCWLNDWYGLTDEQIVEYETNMFAEIGKVIGEATKDAKPEEEPKEIDFDKLKLDPADEDSSSNLASSRTSTSASVSDEEDENEQKKQDQTAYFDPLNAVALS